MKKILSIALLVALMVGVLAGCSTTPPTAAPAATTAAPAGETTAAPAAAGNFKVGITIQSLENSYWAAFSAKSKHCSRLRAGNTRSWLAMTTPPPRSSKSKIITNEVDLIMVILLTPTPSKTTSRMPVTLASKSWSGTTR
ncbi:MAG: hypothetical protein LRY35_04280 [Clostridiales bacterium]|nr:hypothetical protein [Clostridiales bacterium]